MVCNVLGCGREAKTRGMCSTHYTRYKRSVDFEGIRPEDWGQKNKHPAYIQWRSMLYKNKLNDGHPWRDFWAFADFSKSKPEGKHRLLPKDPSQNVGPDNYFWQQIQIDQSHRSSLETTYTKEYRKMHPERFANYELKRRFGIGLEEYNEMHLAQNGGCAICGEAESTYHTSKTSKGGHIRKLRKLSVDHCHTTNKIRALLCSHCNKGLGCFKDNEDRLFAAIEYLERFRKLHAE